MSQWKWYVYIIECQDNSYYTGMTWSLPNRFEQHLNGLGCKYTSVHGVKRLAYAEEHTDILVARQRELQIKDWNRKKKQQLIKGAWHADW